MLFHPFLNSCLQGSFLLNKIVYENNSNFNNFLEPDAGKPRLMFKKALMRSAFSEKPKKAPESVEHFIILTRRRPGKAEAPGERAAARKERGI